jgi:opacity protein-like surface antigen
MERFMIRMKTGITVAAATLSLMLGAASTAQAQAAQASTDRKWSAEVGIGWDNGLTGNINSSGVGSLNNQVVVITRNTYNDVYGAGLHLRFGGGYMWKPNIEARVNLAFQSLDADEIVPMGDMGASNLYGQYSDYQALTLDFGLRQYGRLTDKVKGYVEGLIGLGFVDKTDVVLTAPGANFTGEATDFYDQTTAFTLGVNAGVVVETGTRTGLFVQMGLRWVSGMTEIDDLAGTGLDSINDNSSRWTIPFVVGARVRF